MYILFLIAVLIWAFCGGVVKRHEEDYGKQYYEWGKAYAPNTDYGLLAEKSDKTTEIVTFLATLQP